MTNFVRKAVAALVALTAAFALSGCSSSASDTNKDGLIHVVSATPVWASIAEAVGGDRVVAESLITNANQDPHSFEASARDQLTVNRADLAIVNGGGYDDFLSTLLTKSADAKSDGPTVLTVADIATTGSNNEHYWFDLMTVNQVAAAVEAKLTELDPAHAAEFAANAKSFTDDLANLNMQLAKFASKAVLATEPLADYLVASFGVADQTPPAFKHAIENESDAPIAALNDMRKRLLAGKVSALIVNPQTAGSQVQELVAAAKTGKVAVVEIAEFQTEPGQTYLNWMGENIRLLEAALEGSTAGTQGGNGD
jgi:zinc/manganese transport system substrate-binding protein